VTRSWFIACRHLTRASLNSKPRCAGNAAPRHRNAAWATAAPCGTPAPLYGLFAIFYGGDSGGSGDTYVTIAEREIDAELAGAIALVISFFAVLFSAVLLRRERK
jgi:hypothetical protein